MQKIKKRFGIFILLVVALYVVLLIPINEESKVIKPIEKTFEWGSDNLWKQLEIDYTKAKKEDTVVLDSVIHTMLTKQDSLCRIILGNVISPADTRLDSLLINYFKTASLVAVRPVYREKLMNNYSLIRSEIKRQSFQWNSNEKRAKNVLYKLLYGMRIATEEVLLQTSAIPFDAVVNVVNESSATPSANLFGIKVHSGDLLLSRGGAEVSALISRGNNYPGNFSHVALLYVDEKSNIPYLVEAHIEKGVAVSSAEQYIKDKKLRFMVLRPRMQLTLLKQDSMLPHKAAKAAYTEAFKRHIPYDFKMNFTDSTAMFCSEVGSWAYKQYGLQLWRSSSAISSKGVVRWLGDFGVENFVTQMPSDLEYDSQLSVVAEWRNPETLQQDHIDNAVMDALLEQADKGKQIKYNIWQLPVVRVIKAWCVLKNVFGGVGIIPEGMSAQRALKNNAFVDLFKSTKKRTQSAVNNFIARQHYYPPYWQLVALAKSAVAE